MNPEAASGTLWARLEERFGRRAFLLRAGWAFFYLFLGGWLLSNLRYLFPNVLYEPSLLFKAGRPEDYPLGMSEKWKKAQRAWIIRTPEGVYALWARCTHLGAPWSRRRSGTARGGSIDRTDERPGSRCSVLRNGHSSEKS